MRTHFVQYRKIGGLRFLFIGRWTFMVSRSRVQRTTRDVFGWVQEHERLHDTFAGKARADIARRQAVVIDHE